MPRRTKSACDIAHAQNHRQEAKASLAKRERERAKRIELAAAANAAGQMSCNRDRGLFESRKQS